MSDELHPDAIENPNQASLEELVHAIWMAQGADQFFLFLARCNYAGLQHELITQLVTELETTDLQGSVYVIQMEPTDRLLYSKIQATIGDSLPGVVIVEGFEATEDFGDLAVATNNARVQFVENFHFPLVLWLNNERHKDLRENALDFVSIGSGESFEFELTTTDLIKGLSQVTENLHHTALSVDAGKFLDNLAQFLESVDQLEYLRASELQLAFDDLKSRQVKLPPDLTADLQLAQGINESDHVTALFYLHQSLNHWKSQLDDGNLDKIALFSTQLDQPISTPARSQLPQTLTPKLKAALCLFYIGRREYKAVDRFKHQHADWLRPLQPLEQCIALLDQANRPDLVAKAITQLQRLLQRLEEWDKLEQLTERALVLHEVYGTTGRQAQDYGFLSELAQHRQQWQLAKHYAQQALNLIATTPEERRWDEGLYLMLMAQAERQLGEYEPAIEHLNQALRLGDRGHPRIYVRIIETLRLLQIDQKQYWEAFKLKQMRLALESQVGIRAFVGPGRLRPRRVEEADNLETQSPERIALEIKASGRQRDLEMILTRIGRNDHRLIILHGYSGVGKSSLVNAGLIPALKKPIGTKANVTVLVRQYTNWSTEVAQELTTALQQQNHRSQFTNLALIEQEDLNQNLNQAILEQLQQNDSRELRTILIFDQFEEFFFANPEPLQRRRFFEFLADCLSILSVKAVLSLREDYIHYLLECNRISYMSHVAPDILSTNILYRIGNFAPDDTKSIINALTKNSRFYLEPDLIDAVVDDLANDLDEVRPIELQIVGAQLQTEEIKTLEQYQELGTAPKEELVKRYLNEVIYDCGADNSKLATLILYLLTDERGTRPLKTLPELSLELKTVIDKAQMNPNQLDLVLHILCGSGLVTHLPDIPDDRYQLVHDYVAEFIRLQEGKTLAGVIAKLQEEREKRAEVEARENLIKEEKARLEQANLILAKAQKKARKLLKRTFLGTAILTVSVTATVIYIPWWLISRKNIATIVAQVNQEIIQSTSQEVEQLFDSTESIQQLMRSSINRNLLVLDTPKVQENYLISILEANPYVTWIQIGYANGDYIGAQQTADGLIKYHHRDWDPATQTTIATIRTFQNDSGELGLLDEETGERNPPYYTPDRPWYQNAVQRNGEVAWMTYVYSSSGAPGLDSSITFEQDGKVAGVIGVGIELSQVSEYLAQLQGNREGEIFILDLQENLLATSNPEAVLPEEGAEMTLQQFSNSDDRLLQVAYFGYQANSIALEDIDTPMRFVYRDPASGESYLVSLAPISRSNWILGTVIPSDSYLAPIRRNQQMLLMAILIIIISAAGGSILISDRLIRPLQD